MSMKRVLLSISLSLSLPPSIALALCVCSEFETSERERKEQRATRNRWKYARSIAKWQSKNRFQNHVIIILFNSQIINNNVHTMDCIDICSNRVTTRMPFHRWWNEVRARRMTCYAVCVCVYVLGVGWPKPILPNRNCCAQAFEKFLI